MFLADPFTLPFSMLEALTPASMSQQIAAAARAESVALKVDFKENANEYVLHADVPGIPKENVKVELDGNTLHISAGKSTAVNDDKTDERGWRYHRVERTSTFGHRSLRLPPQADLSKISAHVENGVLDVCIPKKQPTEQEKTRTIIPVA
jgi:HSP20 family protein